MPDWDEDDDFMDGFMLGQMAALEGMDLPDGAYLAMADEMGIDVLHDDTAPRGGGSRRRGRKSRKGKRRG